MALVPGSKLGPYEVLAPIGRGGMGEVYRARDSRLHRDVALKVLPDLFAQDPDRLSRFQREAQVLASLNHPNIAAIYGIEEGPAEAGPYVPGGGVAPGVGAMPGVGAGFSRPVRALVLELVEGPTLADRLATGALPLDEALPIARQIAEALETAHEHGVIHRDLKPANVTLRPDGTVKVLDFGLAKALGPAKAGHYVPQGPAEAGPYVQDGQAVGAGFSRPDTMAPTITSPAMMTGAGVILGIAAYRAPEQAKGREAGAVVERSDAIPQSRGGLDERRPHAAHRDGGDGYWTGRSHRPAGRRRSNPIPLLRTSFSESRGRVSPDGRWVAYVSDESGRGEVYVQAFPSLQGKWQVSTGGGVQPVWSRQGDELFYRGDGSLMAVAISSASSFSPGVPRKLFDDRLRVLHSSGRGWAED